MGIVTATSQIDEAKDVKELASLCEVVIDAIKSEVNGTLEFDKNILSQTVEVTFPSSANTELKINHRFGRVITDYIVCGKSVACDVYDGSTTGTSSAIYLKCTVANAVVRIILKG